MPEQRKNPRICDTNSCLEYIDRFATYGTCYITGKNVKRFTKCTEEDREPKDRGLVAGFTSEKHKQAYLRMIDNAGKIDENDQPLLGGKRR